MDLFGQKTMSAFAVGDIVIFQKLNGPSTVAAMNKLRDLRVKTVFVDCDYPPKTNEAAAANLTVCSSEYLATLYKQRGIENVIVLPEQYESLSTMKPRKIQNSQVTCVWFGSIDSVKAIEIQWLRSLLDRRFPDYRLITVSDTSGRDYQWNSNSPWTIIEDCDVALITGNDSIRTSCKSPNRVIQAMALRLPVIAHPVPAYKTIIRHGKNGFLCRGEEEWGTALKELGSASNREAVSYTGYRYARRYFEPRLVGSAWAKLLLDLGNGS